MNSVQEYKCPCCGAPLTFDGEGGALRCASCENEYSVETMEEIDEAEKGAGEASAYDWETYVPREFGSEDAAQFSAYSCPSCGAEVTGDSTMAASVCPYCGNAAIIKGQFAGSLMPDYVILLHSIKRALWRGLRLHVPRHRFCRMHSKAAGKLKK